MYVMHSGLNFLFHEKVMDSASKKASLRNSIDIYIKGKRHCNWYKQ